MSDLEIQRRISDNERRAERLRKSDRPGLAGCRIFNSGNISINSGSSTALTFDSERYDYDTMHDTSSNTGRITVNTAGRYAFWAMCRFATNATGFREVAIRLNGTINIAILDTNAISGAPTIMTCAGEFDMAVGDYAEVVVFQNSGGALNIENANAYSPEFAAQIMP